VAKMLSVSGVVLVAVCVAGCVSGQGGGGGTKAAVPLSFDLQCKASVDPLTIGDGDRVEFTPPDANHRIELVEKEAESGAYVEGTFLGFCSNTASHASHFTLKDGKKVKSCKFHQGSGPNDYRWRYSVTVYDSNGQQVCQSPDPDICVVRCM